MMKIVVASEQNKVAQHFGHCIEFVLYETEQKKIIKKEIIANPGHKPGFLPVFLSDKGVQVIITGGIGQGAIDIFGAEDICVISGATGDADLAVRSYMEGILQSNCIICHEHQYEDECDH